MGKAALDKAYRGCAILPLGKTTYVLNRVRAEVVYDSQTHEINVPAGVRGVTVRVEWVDPEQDIDLYVYDANGKLVGSSTNFNPDTGDPSEQATAASADPLAPGTFTPGTWMIEVRGYLVLDPQTYDGLVTITVEN